MFCPRCGRPVSEGANFCGGCGLPRREIERYARQQRERMATPSVSPRPQIPDIDLEELTGTIDRLQGDLTGSSPVIDYTTPRQEETTAGDISLTTEPQMDYTRQMPDITRWADPGYRVEEARPQREEVPREEETVLPTAEEEDIQEWAKRYIDRPVAGGVYFDDNGQAKEQSDNLFNGGYTAPSQPAAPQAPRPRQNNTADAGEWKARQNYASTQSSYSYNAPQHPLYNDTRNVPPTYRAAQRPQAQPPQRPKFVPEPKSQTELPLSTVDFIWMMLISSIPLVGLFYLLYLGFIQNDSVTKRSFARAVLIIGLFGAFTGLVFMIGLISSLV